MIGTVLQVAAEKFGGEDYQGNRDHIADKGELEAEKGGFEEGHGDAADPRGTDVGKEKGKAGALALEGCSHGESDIQSSDGGAGEQDGPEVGAQTGLFAQVAFDYVGGDPYFEQAYQDKGKGDDFNHFAAEIQKVTGGDLAELNAKDKGGGYEQGKKDRWEQIFYMFLPGVLRGVLVLVLVFVLRFHRSSPK